MLNLNFSLVLLNTRNDVLELANLCSRIMNHKAGILSAGKLFDLEDFDSDNTTWIGVRKNNKLVAATRLLFNLPVDFVDKYSLPPVAIHKKPYQAAEMTRLMTDDELPSEVRQLVLQLLVSGVHLLARSFRVSVVYGYTTRGGSRLMSKVAGTSHYQILTKPAYYRNAKRQLTAFKI